jgi:cytochrome c oxidase subunit 2
MTSERKRVHPATPFGPVLLLASLFVISQASEGADSIRTIDVTLSRYAFSPERIELRLGERVRLNVVSADRTHGFEVKALGVNARIPAGGGTVTVELAPKTTGTFEVECSEYCGAGHGRMKGWLIVTPVN